MVKKKPLPAAPRATLTLRTFDAPDWRWSIPENTRLYMRHRVSVGMPEEMREAIEAVRDATGLSMSEIGRRCFRLKVIGTIRPGRKS
jgi:hypothetical protein